MFIKNNFNSCVPTVELTDEDVTLLVEINSELKNYLEGMENQKIRDGLKSILKISSLGNAYVQLGKPWKLIKSDDLKERYAACSVA